MRTIKNLFLSIIVVSQLFLVACEKNEEKSNELVGTEWVTDDDAWLFSFKSDKYLTISYNVAHMTTFDKVSYTLDGDKLTIVDLDAKSPHGDFAVIKDFTGTLKGNEITCDFKTTSMEIPEGEMMPTFKDIISLHIVLKKK